MAYVYDYTFRSVKGVELTDDEEENNHRASKERIDDLLENPPTAVDIASVEVSGNSFRFVYTDATTSQWIRIPGQPATYDVGFRIGPISPAAGEIIGIVPVTTNRPIRLAANFAGANGYIDTPPGADYVISVKDDGTTIGTITVRSDGTSTYATTGGTAKTVAGGSILTFVAPDQGTAQDAAIANGVWLLEGEVI